MSALSPVALSATTVATLLAGSTAGGVGWAFLRIFGDAGLCRVATALMEQALSSRERSEESCGLRREEALALCVEKAVENLTAKDAGEDRNRPWLNQVEERPDAEKLDVVRTALIQLCRAGPGVLELVGAAFLLLIELLRRCAGGRREPAVPVQMRAVRRRLP